MKMDNYGRQFTVPQLPHKSKVDGIDIHYKCLGEGPNLLLLHGIGSDWRQWLDNVPFLAQYFRVFALDLPGFGLSDRPDGPITPQWYGAFLKKVMDALNIPNAHIIGHSLGGALALGIAIDFPAKVRRLVVIDSAGLGYLSWTGRVLNHLYRTISALTGKNRLKNLDGKIEDWQLTSRLRTIESPVMILWGGKDPYLPLSHAKQAKMLIPNCQLHVFHCTCHAPQREFADEFHRIVYEFLTE